MQLQLKQYPPIRLHDWLVSAFEKLITPEKNISRIIAAIKCSYFITQLNYKLRVVC